MPIPRALADQLVLHVGEVWGKPLSVADESAVIVASSAPEKIGREIPQVADVFAQRRPIRIMNDHQPAVAIPLKHNDETIGALIVHETWEKLKDYIKVIQSLGDLLASQFFAVTSRIADADDQLIFTLLHSEPTRLPDLMAEAAVLGYDLERPRLSIVIKADGFAQRLGKEAQDRQQREAMISDFKRSIYTALTNFFTRSIDNIVGYLGYDRFVVLKDLSGTDEDTVVTQLAKNFKSIFGKLGIEQLTIGIGRQHTGLTGIQESYREATLALDLGNRLKPELAVHYTADLGLPLLLGHAAPDKRQDFINRVLGNIEDDPQLLETIDIFFRHTLNLTDAARALRVHRNTLIYRLDKVEQLSGLDPRNFLDALHLYMAMLLKKFA